jgi:hypothetical protein
LLGKTTGPSEVTFKNLEHRLQGMAGDGRDLLRRASGFREQGHRGASKVMEVQFHRYGNIGQVTVSNPAFLMTRFQTCEKYLFLNERPVLVLWMRGDACSIPSSIRRNAAVQGTSIIWPSL